MISLHSSDLLFVGSYLFILSRADQRQQVPFTVVVEHQFPELPCRKRLLDVRFWKLIRNRWASCEILESFKLITASQRKIGSMELGVSLL